MPVRRHHPLAHIPEKWIPISGLPDIGALKCANRKHPICVVFRKGYAPLYESGARFDSFETECARANPAQFCSDAIDPMACTTRSQPGLIASNAKSFSGELKPACTRRRCVPPSTGVK